MAIGIALGAGMASQGLFSWLSSSAQASSQRSIAETNAGAMISMSQTNANASVNQTRLEVMGMVFAANTQYLQAMQQMKYADMADRRQSLNWRMQLGNEIKMMTLSYNAQIHADNLSHVERMTSMNYEHDRQLAEINRPSIQEIDPSTLLS